MKTKKITDNRWLQLVVGVIGLLFAGIIYAWSILAAPLAAEFGWSNSQIGLNFTITLSIFCIGGFVSGIISKKTTPMLRMLLAAALIFVSFFISSRLQGSIGVLYIAYGVLGGTAVGLAYNTIIGVVTAWFPDKRGLASGLLLMGFGLNSILIGRIAADMMKNPDIGWRTTYFAIAIVTAAVLAIAAFIIKPPPKDMVFPAPKGGAALRAAEVKADVLLLAKNIDGVYSADPKVDPNAVKFDSISYDEVLARKLAVMDSTATSLSMDNHIPIILFALEDPENILRVILGEKIGTIVG